MSHLREPTIRVRVDPTNPGQFFACCGLLELADRRGRGAEGWFEEGAFCIRSSEPGESLEQTLGELLSAVAGTSLLQLDADDNCSSPIEISSPFNLRLDWWKDNRAGGDRLKLWAGRMSAIRIARAMQNALMQPEVQSDALFDHARVVYDSLEPDKTVEPFYFDARRGSNALAIDIGFSPDPLQMTNLTYPAVEFLCLVGLQRLRPMPTVKRRVFDYHTWSLPLTTHIAPLAVCGLMSHADRRGFRFETAPRTKYLKAFTPATPKTRS